MGVYNVLFCLSILSDSTFSTTWQTRAEGPLVATKQWQEWKGLLNIALWQQLQVEDSFKSCYSHRVGQIPPAHDLSICHLILSPANNQIKKKSSAKKNPMVLCLKYQVQILIKRRDLMRLVPNVPSTVRSSTFPATLRSRQYFTDEEIQASNVMSKVPKFPQLVCRA